MVNDDGSLGNLSKFSFVMGELRKFAEERDLRPSRIYYRWGREAKTPLRFSRSGNGRIEETYGTHFVQRTKPCRRKW
jgi:hypothetical protein